MHNNNNIARIDVTDLGSGIKEVATNIIDNLFYPGSGSFVYYVFYSECSLFKVNVIAAQGPSIEEFKIDLNYYNCYYGVVIAGIYKSLVLSHIT